jgi:phosphatidylserine decarboxylase
MSVRYHPGSFYPAFLPKTSELNERNTLTIQTERRHFVCVVQITGTLARTIVCRVRGGDIVRPGQKFGMMKLGSRIDLYLPAETRIEVAEGQNVYGGQTVIGHLKTDVTV